jgi:hypothetical protein
MDIYNKFFPFVKSAFTFDDDDKSVNIKDEFSNPSFLASYTTHIWFKRTVNYPALQALELCVCFENYSVVQTTSELQLAFSGLPQIKINKEVSSLGKYFSVRLCPKSQGNDGSERSVTSTLSRTLGPF